MGVAAGWTVLEAIEIDLNAVSFIDSSGLGALVRVRNEAAAKGKTLSLVNPGHATLRLLELTGLQHAFDIRSDEPETGAMSGRPADDVVGDPRRRRETAVSGPVDSGAVAALTAARRERCSRPGWWPPSASPGCC